MHYKKISNYISVEFETPADASYWFGYYNYDPLDFKSKRLLCGKIKSDGIAPRRGMTIEVGYFSLFSGEWNSIGDTDSWNWQQGAMAQWISGKGNESKVIYNCSRGGHLSSTIVDIETGETKDINWAIYGLTPDGRKSIALDLERSYWCRAYHYQSVINKSLEGRLIPSDGIFLVDIEQNYKKRIISIEDIIKIDFRPYFDSCKHWVEHIMVSPSGRKFCFLHRFSSEDNVYSYKTRLFIADIDGSNLKIVPGWESFDWSHFGWRRDDGFAIYAYKSYRISVNGSIKDLLISNPLKCLIKVYNALTYRLLPYEISRILNGKRQYYQLYKVENDNTVEIIDELESSLFCIDGHPSFTQDGRYMITDSYPDRKGYQKLIAYDTFTRRGVVLAKLFAGLKNTPASCDLHPKLSRDNERVCVDTAYDGKHHMIVFKLNWEKIIDKLSRNDG